MAKKTSSAQLVHIRMPMAFHRKLMRDAERAGLTLNAEILRRLEWSFDAEDMAKDKAENRAVLDRIERLSRDIQSILTAGQSAVSPTKGDKDD